MKNLTVGIIQPEIKLGDIEANLEKGCRMIADAAAKGAQIVLLPELFTTGYHSGILGKRYADLAETRTGRSVSVLSEAARKHNVYVYFGFPEKRTVPGIVYNSSAFIGPNGKLIDTYAKTHLYAGERLFFAKGDRLFTVETEIGVFGPLICYDAGFPEIGRILALKGAEILLCLSAWCLEDRDIWFNNLMARATDNLMFVAGCNHAVINDGLHLIGESMIVAPRGHIIQQASADKETVLIQTVDLDQVHEARKNCLYFLDRRPDLYQMLSMGEK